MRYSQRWRSFRSGSSASTSGSCSSVGPLRRHARPRHRLPDPARRPPVIVDLREAFLEIPSQTAITKDNAPISIDFIIFNRVMDAVDSVVKVQNFPGAAQNVAATTLRSVVGDMPLDDVLSKRDEMNALLQSKLDEITERWGVKVTTRRRCGCSTSTR